MFKVQNTVQDENGIVVFLDYTISNALCSMEIRTASQKASRIKFCQVAHDFLQFTIDDLYEELQKIRKHYFNRDAVPYINDTTWTTAYWNFLTMRTDVNAMRNDPKQFSLRVYVTVLENLIPYLNFENKKSIETKIADIKRVSGMILNNLKKLHNETTISVC